MATTVSVAYLQEMLQTMQLREKGIVAGLEKCETKYQCMKAAYKAAVRADNEYLANTIGAIQTLERLIEESTYNVMSFAAVVEDFDVGH